MELKRNKGIAILMAVLTLSVILAVGLTLINVIVKQLNITSGSRESVVAVYAADTGIECALFWDIRGYEYYTPPLAPGGYPVFSTSSSSYQNPGSPTAKGNNGLTCSGGDITTATSQWGVIHSANAATTSFRLDLTNGSAEACAKIEIAKHNDGTFDRTSITSRGYNARCTQINSNPRTVERAIKVRYIF